MKQFSTIHIFGYGETGAVVSMTNLVSNTGVVATDTTGVGTGRNGLAAACYGSDKAIFGYGSATGGDAFIVSITNKVSNVGVVATDTAGKLRPVFARHRCVTAGAALVRLKSVVAAHAARLRGHAVHGGPEVDKLAVLGPLQRVALAAGVHR